MAFSGTGKIWMNGKLVNWADANIHIASHVIHYGSAVFEGARCYKTPKGSAFFRLDAHMRRLYDSARIYRMDYDVDCETLTRGVIDTVIANGMEACYIRPLIYRGYHTLGVNPLPCPVEAAILVWEWGAYLGADALEKGVDVKVSSWTRSAPNTFPAMAKSVANYANSGLIKMEAVLDGYSEGIALNPDGLLSEGSGQNLFLVRDGVLYTPPLAASVLRGYHARQHHDAGEGSGPARARAGHAAGDALRRGRGLLRRHGRRDYADPVGRQDPGRRGTPRARLRPPCRPRSSTTSMAWCPIGMTGSRPSRSRRRQPRRRLGRPAYTFRRRSADDRYKYEGAPAPTGAADP